MQDERLSDVLGEFARTMVTDFPIQAILDHLVQRIVEVLPVTSAGVTLISPGRDPHYIAASSEAALRYEQLQTELAEGPCLAAYLSGEAVAIPDLAQAVGFPVFAPHALDLGLVAVFTFPLRHGDKRLGALDLYRESPGGLDAETMSAAQTLADVTAAYLLNAQAREDLISSSARFRESSLHDALTGLPNRVLLRQRLEHATSRARRSHSQTAILFVDVDRFKEVNDIYGHRIGDELLVAVAERLSGLVRSGDTVARMSGDEFVVLCEDLEIEADATVLAGRIVTALNRPFELGGTRVYVSASVGIAFAGSGANVPDQVLVDADEAMYQAKRAGGGQHQVIDLRERSHRETRASLELDLFGATSRGELRPDYQPIVSTVDGRIVGIEALLRWDHPELGLVSPLTVIPLAEQSNLINDIGGWMLARTCLDLQRLRHVSSRADLRLSVNVSPRQLMANGFSRSVERVVATLDADPELLILEVTEGACADDSQRAAVVLKDLKTVGVTLALDNFGVGDYPLAYLQRFPFDIVKLDRSITAESVHDRTTKVIAASVVELAHSLNQTVVAEGVETAAQHDLVTELGCEWSQGFYYDLPMACDDLDRHLQFR